MEKRKSRSNNFEWIKRYKILGCKTIFIYPEPITLEMPKGYMVGKFVDPIKILYKIENVSSCSWTIKNVEMRNASNDPL